MLYVSTAQLRRHQQKAGTCYDSESVDTFCTTVEYKHKGMLSFIRQGAVYSTFEWWTMEIASGETVAAMVVVRDEGVLVLQHMAVCSGDRHKGLGTKMIDAIRTEVGTIILSTIGERATDFFKTRGFDIRKDVRQQVLAEFGLEIESLEGAEFMASGPISTSKFHRLAMKHRM